MECSRFVLLAVLLFRMGNGSKNGAYATDCVVPAYAANFTQEHFLSLLTASCRYDKYVIPESSMPLNVTVKVDVKHLEVKHTEFTAHLTVQLMYKDEKLNYENLTTSRLIFGDEDVKSQIWTPRLQLKDQSDTTVISTKEEDVHVSIDKTGLVSYTYKMEAKFHCWMDLKKFPFDSQKCTLTFSDWSYNNAQLQLYWNSVSPSVFANNFHFTEFVIDEIEYTDGNNDGPYEISAFSLSLGDFSELTIKFKFHRDVGYYLVDFFLPSYLLVCTAWVTFWLQADAGPPRVTLGASTVVAFITLHLSLSKDIPKVSYIKASDIWFLGVSCFIFFSLAEFAFVNVIWRRKKVVELKKPNPKYILKSALMPSKSRDDLRRIESQVTITNPSNGLKSVKSENNMFDPNYRSRKTSQVTLKIDEALGSIPEKEEIEQTPEFTWTTMTPQEVATYIDRKARIIFPICFLLFNLMYWTYVYC